MHGEGCVRQGTSAAASGMVPTIESNIGLRRLLLRLKAVQGRVTGRPSRAGRLSATVEARTIIIVAFPNDLPATYNDASMTVVKRRQGSLLEAKRQISIVARHIVRVCKVTFGFRAN